MPGTEITRPRHERRSARYASDLTDAQWALIGPNWDDARARRLGRPRGTDLREVVNAPLHMASSGGAWRPLQKDFSPFSTANLLLALARRGPAARNRNELVTAAREGDGREKSQSAGVMDSQSVKTIESRENRRFDAGKKVKGRKRRIVVDTLGLLLGLVVYAADIQARPRGLTRGTATARQRF